MKKIISRVAVIAVLIGLFAGILPGAALANGDAYDVSTYKNSGTYPSAEGKIFAGWFEDEALTVPYTKTTGSAYAKFGSGDVLGVKAQIGAGATAASASANLRLITTVDSAYYASAGFFITVNGKEQRVDLKLVYSTIYASGGKVYKPSDVSAGSAFFMTYVLADIPKAMFGEAISVVPFWQTLDGTVVRGTGRDIVLDDYLEKISEDSDYVKYVKSLYPDYKESEYGLDITFRDDLVGINYSTWHDYAKAYNFNKIYDLSKILAGQGSFGPTDHFHYWSEPALGYYSNMDESVIRTHMTQLSEAGVDFIVIDNTNLSTTWVNAMVGNSGISGWDLYGSIPAVFLLDTCLKMRNEGLKTPYVIFWNRIANEGWGVCHKIYDDIVKKDKYKDLWVYWRVDATGESKPLMLGTGMTGMTGFTDYAAMYNTPAGKMTLAKKFNYRTMWGLQNSETQHWSFLNNTVNNPRAPITDANTGKTYYEQICVCAAAQQSYMSLATATSRNHGVTFYNQWKQAFKYRPKIVILTWWNEWVAQRQPNGEFVDLYTPEYSRDLEPMKGGFGDQYYQWMIQYIAAYKGHKECPRLVEAGY